MTTILDGKALRDKIFEQLKFKVDLMPQKPTLIVILVGNNPASRIYVNNKKKWAEKLGIISGIIELPEDVSEEKLCKIITILNNNDNVNAILVQLPLPPHINKTKVIETISPKKDVDGLTSYNSGRLFSGQKPYAYPCTPKGIMSLLDEYDIQLDGKLAVVIGRSNLVGKPVAQMLLKRNATVVMCHSHTKNLSDIIKTADIIVSAVGKNIVGEKNILKSDCVIVDVGIFKGEDGKTRGDVDFEYFKDKIDYISPVPGGVGPMTIASLMENTVTLAELQFNNLRKEILQNVSRTIDSNIQRYQIKSYEPIRTWQSRNIPLITTSFGEEFDLSRWPKSTRPHKKPNRRASSIGKQI